MSTKAEQLALLKKKLSMAKTKIGKAVLEKKIEKLKSEMGSSIKAKKDVTEAKKKVSQMSIAELKKKPEFKFLKKMNKGKIEDDQKHVAKPKGWRFKGKGKYRKPTKSEIVAGKKRGNVYYEARNRRSDVSRIVRLKDGGGVNEEKLYYVVGKKKGQLVDISTDSKGEITPMTKQDAQMFAKDFERNYDYNSIDIIPYRGKNSRIKYATGGGVGREIGYGREKYNALSKESKKKLLHETIGVGTQWFNEDYDKLSVSHQFNIDEYFKGKYATGGGVDKYVIKEDKDGTFMILNTQTNMYVDRVFDTRQQAEYWKEEKDIQRKTFGRESYFNNGGGVRDNKGLSNSDKFISDQLYYVISVKSISEKKKIIKDSLLPNIDDYVTDNMTNKITKDNLKYALQQKTVASINNVLKRTINAFRKDEYATGGGMDAILQVGDMVKIMPNYSSHYANEKGEVVKEMPDGKTYEIKIKHKRGNEYVKFDKSDLIFMGNQNRYSNGGGVGGYKGKTAEEVWNGWSKQQKQHFIADHNDAIFNNTDDADEQKVLEQTVAIRVHGGNVSFKNLEPSIKEALQEHVLEGQYANGGGVGDVVITIESGNDGELDEVWRGKNTIKNQPIYNKVYKNEIKKGKSVFLYENGVLMYTDFADLDEGKYATGGGVKDNRMNERTRAVILKIQKTGIHPDDVSPNFVNEIANEYEIKLTSEEVVFISDNYGNKYAKGSTIEDHEASWVNACMKNHSKEECFIIILKDSQFSSYVGKPKNEYTHNRLPKKAIVNKDSVNLTTYTPNTGRHLDTIEFTDPTKLLKYLNKNEIMAKGGDLFTGEQHRSETMMAGGKVKISDFKYEIYAENTNTGEKSTVAYVKSYGDIPLMVEGLKKGITTSPIKYGHKSL